MLKNQGFIYITHCQLANAPLIKVSYESSSVLPAGFIENHSALAVWPITGKHGNPHKLLDTLHAHLITNGLAFTIPKVYQASLTQFVSFIDEWLEVERHFEGVASEHDFNSFPVNSNFIHESTIDLKKLGHAWLTHEPAYEHSASSAFYRGMVHGQIECQLQMARCYEEGVGVEVNYSRARELLHPIKNHPEVFPILLRLSYLEKKTQHTQNVKDDFFARNPLPLPGKMEMYGAFHQTLLDLLWVSFEQAGHFDVWLSNWELVSPYREELLALSEVRVMDSLDSPEASQTRNFHDILAMTFNSYRHSA